MRFHTESRRFRRVELRFRTLGMRFSIARALRMNGLRPCWHSPNQTPPGGNDVRYSRWKTMRREPAALQRSPGDEASTWRKLRLQHGCPLPEQLWPTNTHVRACTTSEAVANAVCTQLICVPPLLHETAFAWQAIQNNEYSVPIVHTSRSANARSGQSLPTLSFAKDWSFGAGSGQPAHGGKRREGQHRCC